MPQSRSLRHLIKAEDLFHTAVAVRCDHENVATHFVCRRRNAKDNVVMKLPLLPMIEQLVRIPPLTNLCKKRPEHQMRCQLTHDVCSDGVHIVRIALDERACHPPKVGADQRDQ